jgi:hypothetical protein
MNGSCHDDEEAAEEETLASNRSLGCPETGMMRCCPGSWYSMAYQTMASTLNRGTKTLRPESTTHASCIPSLKVLRPWRWSTSAGWYHLFLWTRVCLLPVHYILVSTARGRKPSTIPNVTSDLLSCCMTSQQVGSVERSIAAGIGARVSRVLVTELMSPERES